MPARRVPDALSPSPAHRVIAPSAAVAAPQVLDATVPAPHPMATVRETAAAAGAFVDPGGMPRVRCTEVARGDAIRRGPRRPRNPLTSSRRVDPGDLAVALFAASLAPCSAWGRDGGAAPRVSAAPSRPTSTAGGAAASQPIRCADVPTTRRRGQWWGE